MRGQAFSVMKILIGAVFAATLLYIVLQVSGVITPEPSAMRDLDDMITNALSAREECIQRNIMYVQGDTYSKNSFKSTQDITFQLYAPYNQNFVKTDSTLSPMNTVQALTSAKCTTDGKCTIHVGSENCGQ